MDIPNRIKIVDQLLAKNLSKTAIAWLTERVSKISMAASDTKQLRTLFFLSFSASSRKAGDAALTVFNADDSEEEFGRIVDWTHTDLARYRLLLTLDWNSPEAVKTVNDLTETADNGELISIFRALAYLPEAEKFVARFQEGLRTNVSDVFMAIAHNNVFPAEHLPEAAWNQMVLKALFMGLSLNPILGLDSRANIDLSLMLCDYARERWAAGRHVSPELWRPVALAINDERVPIDLSRALSGSDCLEARGAALALKNAPVESQAQFEELLTKIDLAGISDWNQLLAS